MVICQKETFFIVMNTHIRILAFVFKYFLKKIDFY